MLETVLTLLIAPVLVGVATLASRRWDERIGGLVSAFPAIVGPVLLITAHEHGTAYAAEAANGTLLGLVALSGFVVVYGRVARHWGWRASLAAAWVAATALGSVMAAVGGSSPAGLIAAVVSLALAHRALPRPVATGPRLAAPRGDVWLRMGLTVVLVASLAAATARFGPLIGGILAALPVLASVLAVFTHLQGGAPALAALLRGMLAGMAGFVAFCAVVSLVVIEVGVTAAFTAAVLAALLTQAAAVYASRRPPPRRARPSSGSRLRQPYARVAQRRLGRHAQLTQEVAAAHR